MPHSLDALLRPRSVAVVGASRTRSHVGGEIFANLVGRPFCGTVYPVHAEASDVQGVRAYPSIAALPQAIDLAVIAVPAPGVLPAVEQCAAAGTKSVVIVSAGFGESGDAGKRAQARVLELAGASGIRVVGPNCLGVLNTDPEVALHATFSTDWPPAGNVSVASQSGALGIALLDQAREHGIGIRHFVSLGNEADVSAEHLLAYWENDPVTQVILLYLESLPNPRRFLDAARRVTRTKPVIAVKSGRSLSGARAAGSHTGALATKDALIDALLAQAGVVRVATLEELFDAATLLATRQAPFGKRVAIVTNAGGPGILTADACEARGLTIPAFEEATADALAAVVQNAAARNPLDLLAGATAHTFDAAIPLVLGDPSVDEVIVECVPTTNTDVRDVAKAIAAARKYHSKPIVACVLGKRGVEEARDVLRKAWVPTYSLPESAAGAIRAACEHATARRLDVEEATPIAPSRRALPASIRTTDGWLTAADTADLFGAFGLRLLPSACAFDTGETIRAAEMLGWPVALKVMSKAVLHKSDVGGVILGVRDANGVREGIATIRRRLKQAGHEHDLDGFLVQPMAPRGVEMFLGAKRDPAFGPVIAFGTGGVQLELWNDVVLRLGPVSAAEASRMIESIRGRRLLDGFRGSPAGDRVALCEAIVQVSRLVAEVPEIVELDVNPLLALEPGRGVIAVDARVRVAASESLPRS
jgi:acetyl coenzyme A synthetase (ADP forming)-like protein